MACAPVLLVLICYCTCSGAQFALSQESSLTVSPGSTVKLSCSRTSGSIGGDNYPSWYQQRPGGVPLLLVYSTGASAVDVRPPGIDARFSGSVSGSRAYLTISVAEARDDAVYYCMMYAGSGTGRYIFGGGTQLNVLTGETQAPTLSIFPPSLEEVEKNKATVVCLLQDFYPASLDVTWKVDGQIFTNGVEKSRATKQSENNLFMASSYLSLPPMDWSAEKTVTCQVTHQGKTFEKSVKKSECV